jgi:hypothetical protein
VVVDRANELHQRPHGVIEVGERDDLDLRGMLRCGMPMEAAATPESAIWIMRASFAAVLPLGSGCHGRSARAAASISIFSTAGFVLGPVEMVAPPRSLHGTSCCAELAACGSVGVPAATLRFLHFVALAEIPSYFAAAASDVSFNTSAAE